MEITTITTGTALRSGFVAPTVSGAWTGVDLVVTNRMARVGGVRPKHAAPKFAQATVPSAAFAGTGTGPNTWSPPDS